MAKKDITKKTDASAKKDGNGAATVQAKAKDRRANFARLATIRTNNALKAIQLIGNLSNINDYEFTDKDVSDIFEAIRTELAAAEARFQVSKVRASRRIIQIAA